MSSAVAVQPQDEFVPLHERLNRVIGGLATPNDKRQSWPPPFSEFTQLPEILDIALENRVILDCNVVERVADRLTTMENLLDDKNFRQGYSVNDINDMEDLYLKISKTMCTIVIAMENCTTREKIGGNNACTTNKLPEKSGAKSVG